MGGSMAALMAAAAAVSLLMLLVSLAATDRYDQETRRIFVEWKGKYGQTYKDVGEEECRYAVFKDTRRIVDRHIAAGITSSGLNGLSARSREEILRGKGVRMGEASYEQETRLMFVGWKAKYGKTYKDVGEEECRYKLFKGNRRVVVQLNAAAGETAYGINQLGDLTNEEVRACCYGRGGFRNNPEIDGKLSARCQAAAADLRDTVEGRLRSQVCQCIAMELEQSTESGGSAIPGDRAHM
ncbi:oryzain alpha chain-like [Lolium perenne]|uniref:oryzain alpha chain-like n=1 Tax=Lolium perenne TaxID=4522 RepID=UPI0021EA12D4|nr:oryzain alpha chain-like [Lolium perenne]